MLFWKKKKKLFGSNIQVNCALCQRNLAREGERVRCGLDLYPEGGICKKFLYDPLLRTPSTAPKLQKERFSPKDFEL